MSVEALLGTDVAFAAAYQLARPHPGQIAVAAELRHLLRDSALQTGHHGHAHKVQDPYSLRCVPQVHGAVRDALDHLRRVLDIELNSATDNPLVFPGGGVADEDTIATGGGRVISGGNFHGEPIALALDFAKIALAELGSISERRTALLVDPRLNGGLPPFLAAASGIDSGMMIYQYTAAALVSENKVLAHPGVGRLDPDEREPGGPRLDGLDLGAPRADGRRARRADPRHRAARRGAGARPAAGDCPTARRARRRRRRGACAGSGRVVRHLDGDREPGPDLAAATALVHDGALADLARPRRLRQSAMGTITDPRRHRRGGIRPHPALRRPGLRPSLVRLLGGRRPRLEGGAPVVAGARRCGPGRARPRPKPTNPFLADLEAKAPVANPFATARPGQPVPDPGRRR